MIKQMCSIFGFYKCLITNNPNKYDYVTKHHKLFWVLVTPVIMMVAHMLLSLVTFNYNLLYSLYIHVIFISVNLIVAHTVKFQAQDLQYKLNREQEEQERLNRKKERTYEYEEQEKRKKTEAEYAEFLKWKENFQEKQRTHYKKQEKQEKLGNNSVGLVNNVAQRAYQVLEIEPTLNIEVIKKAFRKLSKQYHPDMHTGDETQFIKVKEAYDYLIKKAG